MAHSIAQHAYKRMHQTATVVLPQQHKTMNVVHNMQARATAAQLILLPNETETHAGHSVPPPRQNTQDLYRQHRPKQQHFPSNIALHWPLRQACRHAQAAAHIRHIPETSNQLHLLHATSRTDIAANYITIAISSSTSSSARPHLTAAAAAPISSRGATCSLTLHWQHSHTTLMLLQQSALLSPRCLQQGPQLDTRLPCCRCRRSCDHPAVLHCCCFTAAAHCCCCTCSCSCSGVCCGLYLQASVPHRHTPPRFSSM